MTSKGEARRYCTTSRTDLHGSVACRRNDLRARFARERIVKERSSTAPRREGRARLLLRALVVSSPLAEKRETVLDTPFPLLRLRRCARQSRSIIARRRARCSRLPVVCARVFFFFFPLLPRVR